MDDAALAVQQQQAVVEGFEAAGQRAAHLGLGHALALFGLAGDEDVVAGELAGADQEGQGPAERGGERDLEAEAVTGQTRPHAHEGAAERGPLAGPGDPPEQWFTDDFGARTVQVLEQRLVAGDHDTGRVEYSGGYRERVDDLAEGREGRHRHALMQGALGHRPAGDRGAAARRKGWLGTLSHGEGPPIAKFSGPRPGSWVVIAPRPLRGATGPLRAR